MAANLHHILSVVTAVIEGICFTGVIYGWPSLTYVLANEGYFREQCEDAPNTTSRITLNATEDIFNLCNEQKESLVIVSSLGQASLSFSHFIFGFIYDRYGTLVTRSAGTIVYTLGCLIMAFSDPLSSWLLYPGMTMISVGGASLVIPNMKLGNLFVAKRATVISLIEGSIDASTITFLFVKLAYQAGFSMRTSFLFMAISSLFQWVRTFLFMPLNQIPFPLPERNYKLGVCKLCHQQPKVQYGSSSQAISKLVNEEMPFIKSLKDLRFWLNVMHVSILRLRAEMFISVFGDWLLATFPDKMNKSILDEFINMFSIMSIFLLGMALFNGLCCDTLIKHFIKKTGNERLATSKATVIMLTTTSFLGVLFSVTVCIPNLYFQYFSFVVLYLLVAFLFGGHTSYIALTFPKEHFGRLFGLSRTFSAIVSLAQYPLSVFVFRICNNNFFTLHIIFVLACIFSFLHPLVLHLKNNRTNDENNNKNHHRENIDLNEINKSDNVNLMMAK